MAAGKRISSRIIANYSHLFAPSTSNNVQSSLKNDASHVVSTANNGGLPMGEASLIADRPSLPHSSAPETETTIIASSSKKKRGPNRGVALKEHYRTKGKVSIIIPEGLNRPVGEHHSKLSREAGIIIRNFAPMQVERWEQVSDAVKELLLNKLLVKINLSIEESHVKDCVMHTMSKRFSDFRSKAYVHYKKHGGGMLARQKPYKELIERPADWIWLCNFLTQKHLRSNCRNRSMLKVIHRMGTKSLVAHLYDQEKMMEIREKIIEDGGIVDETIICAEVLGETSSYIRGLCYGPKPIKKTKIVKSNVLSVRETELETSLKVIQEKYEEQSKIIKSQQKTIDWLKMMAEKMDMQPPNDDGPDFSNEENDY
ncbi:hypothetical protein KFK09_004080 [Dendrobium nobile]|uniref:Uncharacterized protein n=1 Tax=Dendrobium nobile TaxID=94219 RepID=A0A8T3C567_DENNO|nr:hypothetical protein KFK09_004080 [Dendrobium nobile]